MEYNDNKIYRKIGVTTSKKIESNFDSEYDKFKSKALDMNYDGELKFVKEKKRVTVYMILDLIH
jgi:hypothetical protein